MTRIESILATKIKRKSQTCKVFELKVDISKLSQKSIKHLNQLFIEAKWFYNYCISQYNINDADTTLKSVPVKVGDNFEIRNFSTLKSHMKQSTKKRIFSSIKTLKSLRNKGCKVGKLRFKTQVNSVNLAEYHKDYDINYENSTVRLSGLKQKLKVRGLEQIPKDSEIANANIIKKDHDYYFHVTTFSTKVNKIAPKASIGIDFGCKTQLTLSDGTKIEFQVPVSNKIKRLDRRISKKVNGKIGKDRQSNNRKKLQKQRRKAYLKLVNRKSDIKNKIVNAITSNYENVCFQDESIHAWYSGGHGKKIQSSAIGGILSALKHKAVTPIEVEKKFPSTQLCPKCGNRRKLSLNERVYICECEYRNDRDVHSAQNIKSEGIKLKKIPVDYRDLKIEENQSSICFNTLSKISGIKVSKIDSLSQEAVT